MRRKRLVFALAAALFLSSIVRPMACRYLKIDACLDAGGRWNYDARRCEL